MLRRGALSLPVLFAMVASACGGAKGSPSGGSGTAGGDGAGSGTGGSLSFDSTDAQGGAAGAGSGAVCETASSDAELRPVYLAFVFDVSGSMGKLDQPNFWHDPTKKWLPVTQATRAFFASSSSEGVHASLSLFPKLSSKCSASSYLAPEVAFEPLPSPDFGAVLDDYESEVGSPLVGGDWRGSTPTLAAFQGTLQMIEAEKKKAPSARFAVVLVTDGLPQGCSDDSLATVNAAVSQAAASGISTYVIGVQNPTTVPASLPAGWTEWGCGSNGSTPCSPPANLSALNDVAASGGTEAAFLIETDDASAAQSAFSDAIAAIQGKSASCELAIPDSGASVDPDYISPGLLLDNVEVPVSYDPDCAKENSWHFDDAASPSEVVLCPATCAKLSANPAAAFNINFLCERRVDVR